MTYQNTGMIFKIQRYSIHDGPGIRTVIFFKGCPMRCVWCSNPESQEYEPEAEIDQNSGIHHTIGEVMSIKDVMQSIVKDRIFYRKSGGGVTLSGGEPLAQIGFAEALLGECYKLNIHTAVETAGCVPWKWFERILKHVELFLYDIKQLDESDHEKFTGISNKLILENIHRLSDRGNRFIVRIPLVPKLTATSKNIDSTGKFISNLSQIPEAIHLLPFHQYGSKKYRNLCRPYELEGWRSLVGSENEPNSEIQKAKKILEGYGLRVQIGG